MELSFKSPFKERRQELICKLIAKHGDGIVLLISDLEDQIVLFIIFLVFLSQELL